MSGSFLLMGKNKGILPIAQTTHVELIAPIPAGFSGSYQPAKCIVDCDG